MGLTTEDTLPIKLLEYFMFILEVLGDQFPSNWEERRNTSVISEFNIQKYVIGISDVTTRTWQVEKIFNIMVDDRKQMSLKRDTS